MAASVKDFYRAEPTAHPRIWRFGFIIIIIIIIIIIQTILFARMGAMRNNSNNKATPSTK